MGQPREFPDFPDPGRALPLPDKNPRPSPYIEPIPELHLWQYLVEVTDYFALVDELGTDAFATLIERWSGGRIKKSFLMDFDSKSVPNKFIKEIFGFFGAQVFKQLAVGRIGNVADQYLNPGVDSPVDLERREAQQRYIRSGLILSPEREAQLLALITGTVSAGAARATPAEYLETLFRGGRLAPSPALQAILNGSAILNNGVQLVGNRTAAIPPRLLVQLAMTLARGVVRDLVTERADP